jgi:hypothetical protein
MNVYVWYGATIDELIDEYGISAMLESVFEVECECGEVYPLEPDGVCTCCECGKRVVSPLVANNLI